MTLDLNMPSFHRSASEPSVVFATYMEKKKKKKKTGEKTSCRRLDKVNVCMP